MRLHSKHRHKQSKREYELQMIQEPTRSNKGTEQWLILKNPSQKWPISVSREDFEENYESVSTPIS